MAKPKNSAGVPVYGLFHCLPYWDGGNHLLSLHRSKVGAKAAHDKLIGSGDYTKYDLDIQKFELED
jgi:hypothetical protein